MTLDDWLHAVVDAYEALGAPGASVNHAVKSKYRSIYMEGWPTAVHYEFWWRDGQLGVELHCGGIPHGTAVAAAMAEAFPELAKLIDGARRLPGPPNVGAGSFGLEFARNAAPHAVAQAMADFQRTTHLLVTAALRRPM